MKNFNYRKQWFYWQMFLHRLGKKNYELLELESDLVNFEDVKSEIETKNPNIIIHLAAKTEVENLFIIQLILPS